MLDFPDFSPPGRYGDRRFSQYSNASQGGVERSHYMIRISPAKYLLTKKKRKDKMGNIRNLENAAT
jgi:hypothetical protein